MSTETERQGCGSLQRVVRRLALARFFKSGWKRLRDSGSLPRYFKLGCKTSVWDLFRKVEAREEAAQHSKHVALNAMATARGWKAPTDFSDSPGETLQQHQNQHEY